MEQFCFPSQSIPKFQTIALSSSRSSLKTSPVQGFLLQSALMPTWHFQYYRITVYSLTPKFELLGTGPRLNTVCQHLEYLSQDRLKDLFKIIPLLPIAFCFLFHWITLSKGVRSVGQAVSCFVTTWKHINVTSCYHKERYYFRPRKWRFEWSIDLTKVTSNQGQRWGWNLGHIPRSIAALIPASFTQRILLKGNKKKIYVPLYLYIDVCVHRCTQIHNKNMNMTTSEGWYSETLTRGRGSTQERGGQGFAEAP